MPLWHEFQCENIETVPGRNGTTKFTVDGGKPLRFQIPKGRVLYNGLSEFGSITVQVPFVFATWWRETFEPAVSDGLIPFNSNMKESGLRVKLDRSTQIFNSDKQIEFPELKEGFLEDASITCIVEVTGTYFFKDAYGLTCRVYQLVYTPVEEEESSGLKGFSFTIET